MKKILNLFSILVSLIGIVWCSFTIISAFTLNSEKKFGFKDISHIMCEETNLEKPEVEFLDSVLKQNENVLIIFSDVKKNDISKDNMKDIVKNYYKGSDEIPYVVFKYDFDNKTLNTISNDNTTFKDIHLEGVEYIEVYKYIPTIHSKIYIPEAFNYFGAVIWLLFGLGFCIYLLIISTKEVYKYTAWHKSKGMLYKYTFFQNGIKVKIDKKTNTIKEIKTNLDINEDKQFFVIPKNYKKYGLDSNDRNIRIVSKDEDGIYDYFFSFLFQRFEETYDFRAGLEKPDKEFKNVLKNDN